jgi:hypothetical protein
LVYEPKTDTFHLFDTVASERESPIDLELLPLQDDDRIEHYYGSIPHQGASVTNCGVLTLMNLARIVRGYPLEYDGSSTKINGIIRPFLAASLCKKKMSLSEIRNQDPLFVRFFFTGVKKL